MLLLLQGYGSSAAVNIGIVRTWTLRDRATDLTLVGRDISLSLRARSTGTTLADRDTELTVRTRTPAWTLPEDDR